MKSYSIILLFIFSNLQSNSAQSHYDSRLYNDNFRSETGQIKTICPCEAANFFSNRQNMYANRPVIISQNCPQYTLAYTNNRAITEGFTFSNFFKRFKRKRKVTYPKDSHIIIPLVRN